MQLPFFSVSMRKLGVIRTVTFCPYQAYGFYRHWIAVRNFNHICISAAACTVVSTVFAFGLLKGILDTPRFPFVASLGFSVALRLMLFATSATAHSPPPFL